MAAENDTTGIQGISNPETKLKADGTPDRRFKEHGGGTHGNQGGRETGFEEIGDGTSSLRTETQPEEGVHKPNLHGGQTVDGGSDDRTSSEHGFGGDRELASEAGKKGGKANYVN